MAYSACHSYRVPCYFFNRLIFFPNTNWLPITLLSSVLIAQQNAFALAHHHHHTEISCSLSISCLFGGFFLHNWLLQLIFKEILMCTRYTNNTINFLHFSHACFFNPLYYFKFLWRHKKFRWVVNLFLRK